MRDFIATYLNTLLKYPTKKTIDAFTSLMELKTYQKGDVLLSSGKTYNKMFIIKQGLVASFITNEDGNNFIRTLYKENSEIASLKSLIKNEGSSANYKCLMDCELFEASFDEFMKLHKTIPEFNLLHIRVLQKIYLASEKRITELSSFDASQRYAQLKNDIPMIDNILPQYQIASYLNITPVQLSRIRKKIFSK